MQTVPYPVIGYPYNSMKPHIWKIPILGSSFTGPMAKCPIWAPLKAGQLRQHGLLGYVGLNYTSPFGICVDFMYSAESQVACASPVVE